MNVIRCNNGHFYDADNFGSCPHCGGVKLDDKPTAPVTAPMSAEDKPTARMVTEATSLEQAVQSATASHISSGAVSDEGKTVAFYEKTTGRNPVVGWLVCVEGSHQGEDFRLRSGRNFIGRSREMDVAITGDSSVSRDRHAVIIYEPKNHLYMVQPGESKELCYLNGEIVLTPRQLNINDVVSVGNTELMFFPCCGAEFNWNTDDKEMTKGQEG